MATVGTQLLWSGFNLLPGQTHHLTFNVSSPSRIRTFYPRPFMINVDSGGLGSLEIAYVNYNVSKTQGYQIRIGVLNSGGIAVHYDLWQGWIQP